MPGTSSYAMMIFYNDLQEEAKVKMTGRWGKKVGLKTDIKRSVNQIGQNDGIREWSLDGNDVYTIV